MKERQMKSTEDTVHTENDHCAKQGCVPVADEIDAVMITMGAARKEVDKRAKQATTAERERILKHLDQLLITDGDLEEACSRGQQPASALHINAHNSALQNLAQMITGSRSRQWTPVADADAPPTTAAADYSENAKAIDEALGDLKHRVGEIERQLVESSGQAVGDALLKTFQEKTPRPTVTAETVVIEALAHTSGLAYGSLAAPVFYDAAAQIVQALRNAGHLPKDPK